MSLGALANENSVVGVEGKLAGSGVIVIYEGRPAILTVSHLLEGRKTASVLLPQKNPANVVFDSPGFDIALLTLSDKALNEALRLQALFDICSNGDAVCFAHLHEIQPFNTLIGGLHRVEFADHQVVQTNSLFDVRLARMMYDSYVTGAYDHLVYVPAYLSPQASGGALFINGKFFGMIVKVSDSGEPISFAIPITEIGRVVNSVIEGSWSNTPNGSRLTIHVFGQTVSFNPAGDSYANAENLLADRTDGTTHSGSGELVSADSERRLKLWTLGFKDFSRRPEPERTVQITNPFVEHNQDLHIDGKQIAFMRMTTRDGAPTDFYLAPTSANFVFYSRSQSSVRTYPPSEESRSLLYKLRTSTDQKLRFARLYKQTSNRVFKLLNRNCDLMNGDTAQALATEDVQTNANALVCQDRGMVPALFSSHAGSHDLVDLNYSYLGNQTSLRLDRQLKSLVLTTVNGTVELKSDNKSQNYTSIFFKDPTGKSQVRAAIVFDPDDLLKITRIFIEKDGLLIELLACTPGKNCLR